ncbi:MAG: DUF91 domain-containing protein [Candidatus Cloacimonadota bacterium]|nr:MAG: DUF91 domain-containing protein [Candidatus Cloacimonadota bacterium]
MKQYNRIMLGPRSMYVEECYKENYVGADFDIDIDLTGKFPENWRLFNRKFIPIWFEKNPDRSKVAAGLACGMLWTVTKGLQIGDIVLYPDGQGRYYVGEITGDYTYNPGTNLQHRRAVSWLDVVIDRSAMSEGLQRSTRSGGTTCDVTSYAEEIEILIGGKKPPKIISMDETIEDPSVFALEKHLEDFLVKNWKSTVLGKKYKIFEDNGEIVGQQYPSDTGPIDILAISKNKKTLLVVELKKGRATDAVVGQIQRYMGFVKDELAETNQTVEGAIIALEDDLRLKRALSVTNNIKFYKYKIKFQLEEG